MIVRRQPSGNRPRFANGLTKPKLAHQRSRIPIGAHRLNLVIAHGIDFGELQLDRLTRGWDCARGGVQWAGVRAAAGVLRHDNVTLADDGIKMGCLSLIHI